MEAKVKPEKGREEAAGLAAASKAKGVEASDRRAAKAASHIPEAPKPKVKKAKTEKKAEVKKDKVEDKPKDKE